ncbi:MAG TPA: nitrilase-related carbon-nitrogen hydrolase, partial [Candidatus Polarisedimenticolia bacterium]|nr:nitrilase-related carbon-nitrogen hydrolase [Candidatus Polarisedimenticolia bacterium]
MTDMLPRFKAAVVQSAPLPFRRNEGVEKVAEQMRQAAATGAKLALFPEALIPGYPWGLRFGTRIGGRTPEGRRLFARYWANSVEVPGPATARLGQAARDAGIFAAVGVIERDTTYGGGTLFCTLLYFAPDGQLLGKHRKLKPTAGERFLWGEGDGSTLTVLDTEIGRVGGL